MISTELVDLSRLQFAKFYGNVSLFIRASHPRTLHAPRSDGGLLRSDGQTGLQRHGEILGGKLFGINFALGVTTGITMEFQFGTNWSYYSHYVGDIFGAPLAIEGLDGLLPRVHFHRSLLLRLVWSQEGNPPALYIPHGFGLEPLRSWWILVANGWMQNPVGATFLQLPNHANGDDKNFFDVFLSPWAQAKFFHTVSAGDRTGAAFVLAISAWYTPKGRDMDFAKTQLPHRRCLRLSGRDLHRSAGR